MERNIKQVLKDIGWADGFNIPVANDENKKLENEIERLVLDKAELIIKVENSHERLTSMRSVLKKFTKEKEMNMIFINKLRQCLESEMSMLNKSQGQHKSREMDIREIKKEIKETTSSSKKLKDQINLYSSKITELKSHLNWREDALFTWKEDLEKSNRDLNFISHYKLLDQNKFNELEHKRQLIQLELNEILELEKREGGKLECIENQLSQVKKDYKRGENEREHLLQVWQKINQVMKEVENKIEEINSEIDTVKDNERKKLYEYMTTFKQYNVLEKKVKEINAGIAIVENEKIHFNTEQNNALKALEKIQEELNNIQEQISMKESEFNMAKQKNCELVQSLKELEVKANSHVKESEKLKEEIEAVDAEKMTKEQQCKVFEDLLMKGQKVMEEELKEIARIDGLVIKLNEELNNLKETRFIKDRELKELKKTENELRHQKKQWEAELRDLDFTEHDLEVEWSDASGALRRLEGLSIDADEQNKLKERIVQLQEEYNLKNKETVRLRGEIRNLTKELHIVLLDIKQAEHETTDLNEKISGTKRAINGGKKAYIQAQEEYNKNMLKLNLVKIQISFAEENKKKEGMNVSVLERQKIYLDSAMQDRLSEIEGHKNYLLAQRKSLFEEKSFLKRSVDMLAVRIKTLEKRYEIAMDSLCKKTDDGERITLALLKVKIAQEKAELQDLGDDLEAKINKIEKEIQAMENTLRVVSSTNDRFKNNLEALEADSDEVITLNELDSQYTCEVDEIKKIRHNLKDVNRKILELETDIENLRSFGVEAQKEWKMKEKEVSILTQDLSSKQVKLERATKMLQKLSKEVRHKPYTTSLTLALRDIEIRIEADRNKCVLQQLAELASIYIETSPIVKKYLRDKGLTLPPMQDSVYSTRSSTPDIKTSEAGSRMSALSEISSAPSIINLDPTVLLPARFQKNTCRK